MKVTDQNPNTVEPSPGRLLWTGLIMSFCLLVLCLVATAFAVLPLFISPNDASPFAILGGLLALAVSTAMTFVMYLAVISRQSIWATFTSIGFWVTAGFAVFAFVSNAGEAITKNEPPGPKPEPVGPLFWLVFGSICLGIASVCIAYAVSFKRWSKALEGYERSRVLCSRCNYDLRGTLAAKIQRCPECGTPIPTNVSSVNPS